MPGLFSEVLSESGRGGTPLPPVPNSSTSAVGAVLGQVGNLAQNFIGNEKEKFRQQDAQDFQLLRDARKRAIETQQKGDDNAFLSKLYGQVNRVREGTLQGQFSRLEEATRIRRILSTGYNDRPDLAKELRQIDNDLAGIDASDVESSLVHEDEIQKEELFTETVKKYPHLVSFQPDGSINKDRSFERVTTFLGAQAEMELATKQNALQLQMLQGANVSLDIQQKQTKAQEGEYIRNLSRSAAKAASMSAVSFFEKVAKSKSDGTYNKLEARQMAQQVLQQGSDELRLRMIQSGITDQKTIDDTIQRTYGANHLASFLEADELDAKSLETFERMASSQNNIFMLENAAPLMNMAKVFPDATNNLLNVMMGSGEQQAQLASKFQPIIERMIGDGSIQNMLEVGPSAVRLNRNEAEAALPVVRGLMKPNQQGNQTPQAVQGTINALDTVLDVFSEQIERLPEDSSELDKFRKLGDFLTSPSSRQRLQEVFDNSPQEFSRLGNYRSVVLQIGKKISVDLDETLVGESFRPITMNPDFTLEYYVPRILTTRDLARRARGDLPNASPSQLRGAGRRDMDKFNEYVRTVRFLDSKLGVDPAVTEQTLRSIIPSKVKEPTIKGSDGDDEVEGLAGADILNDVTLNIGGEEEVGKFKPLTQVPNS